MAEILPIRRKTLSNQPINQSIYLYLCDLSLYLWFSYIFVCWVIWTILTLLSSFLHVSKLLSLLMISDINECLQSPCVHGSCTNLAGSFQCSCESGWTGNLCDTGEVFICKTDSLINTCCLKFICCRTTLYRKGFQDWKPLNANKMVTLNKKRAINKKSRRINFFVLNDFDFSGVFFCQIKDGWLKAFPIFSS